MKSCSDDGELTPLVEGVAGLVSELGIEELVVASSEGIGGVVWLSVLPSAFVAG